MTVKEALKHFDTGDLVSIAFLTKFVKDNPTQVKKLLEKHEATFSSDPLENFNKIVTLAGLRGRYFTGDLEDVAGEAHYFSLSGVVDKAKDLFGKVTGAVSTVAAPIVTAMTGNPMAGQAAQGLTQGVSNLFSKPAPGSPAVNIQTSPAAVAVAEQVAKVAQEAVDKKEAEDKDKPTFFQQYKWWFIGGGLALLLIIGILLYLRWRKKNKAKS